MAIYFSYFGESAMKVFELCIIIVICAFHACSKAPTENKVENNCRKIAEDVLEPHAEGNFWVRVQEAYTDGQIWRSDTGRIVIERILPVKVNGISYQVAKGRVILPENVSSEAAALCWNGPKGLYNVGMIVPGDTLVTEPRLRFKYPVEVGENWEYPRWAYDPYDERFFITDTLRITCVAKNELFITPLDTFQTIVYHYYYRPVEDVRQNWHLFQYYAPGIGPVGTSVYSSADTAYIYEQRQLNELYRKLSIIDYCLK